MSDVPVIETARLVLREHRGSDHAAYAAMWADDRVVRHIGGVPLTREQCWARIMQYRGMWTMFGFGFFVITARDTGALLGEAGIQDMRRDLDPELGALECGWGLVPAAWGRGLAEEAMRAILDWAEHALPERGLACLIAPGNAASRRLAGKLGFVEARRVDYRGNPSDIWRRP